MKQIITLTILVTALLCGGCASTGKLIATGSTTVDHAMQAWAVFVVDGKASVEQEEVVRSYKNRYYIAEDSAVLALVDYEQHPGDKTNLETAINVLKIHKQNLIKLVESFTGKKVS